MTALGDVLDALDLALGHASAVLDEADLAPAVALAAGARRGRGYLGGTLVVALAGGTGTGKSSLLNALAGSPIASVSRIRPHTDAPLAWADQAAEPGLGSLLDRLGIDLRIEQDTFGGLCIVDLPDQDSVVAGHRATVERLLPEVDLVIWVADPEKYRDPGLHDDYLAPLAPFYARQFLFVLNQVDRLGPDVEAVAADYAAALRESGIPAPSVFATAAHPPDGAPRGVDALAGHLRNRIDAKRAAAEKLFGDVRRAAAGIAAAAGVAGGGSIDFEERWAEASRVAALVVADGHVEDGRCRLEDFVASVSVEAGGRPGRSIRAEVTADMVAASVEGPPEAPAVERRLDRELGSRLRDLLWHRAALAASLAGLDVAVAETEARFRSGKDG